MDSDHSPHLLQDDGDTNPYQPPQKQGHFPPKQKPNRALRLLFRSLGLIGIIWGIGTAFTLPSLYAVAKASHSTDSFYAVKQMTYAGLSVTVMIAGGIGMLSLSSRYKTQS